MPFAPGEPAIHYQLTGVGAPRLVLLRGLGRSSRYWGRLRALLEAEIGLVLIDNRGVGESGSVSLPFTTGDMADDVARVLDHAGVERAHLFGMSLGGMIAQRFALDHGERLERLVLGCTTPGGRAAEPIERTRVWQLLTSRIGTIEQACAREARLLLSDELGHARRQAIAEWVGLARAHPVARTTLLWQLFAAARHDAAAELARVRAPTLVVGASLDRLIPPENSRVLARLIPRAELAWMAAGHDFVTERPEESAALLLEFLR